MQNNTDIYGGVTTQKVSFAYGTIAQAAADTMPGSINFGYDAVTKTGAIFMEKHLMTSRVLSMALGAAAIDGMHTVTVKFLNDANEVSEMTFKTVDESLIQMLIDGSGSEGGEVYMAGEYIDIDASTHAISVDYDPLYNKIKADLIAGGIGDQTEINIHQSEEILGIQKSYVKDVKKVETETDEKYVFTKSTKESETTDAVESEVVLDVVGTEKFDETVSSVNAAVSAVDEKITDASNRIAEEIEGLAGDINAVESLVADTSALLGEKITELGNDVDKKVVDLSTALDDSVSELQDSIDSVSERVVDLSTNVDGAVSDLKDNIDAVNANVLDVSTAVAEVADGVVDLSTNVDRLTEKVLDVSAAVDDLAEKENAFEESVDVVKSRVDAVEEAVLDLSTNKADNTDVDEIKEEISVIDSSINALESDVAQLKAEVSEAWIDIHTLMSD